MKSLRFDEGYLLRLDRGEKVAGTHKTFLHDERIEGGTITGLGGIRDAELGFFDLESRSYKRSKIPGILELVHYFGIITLVDGNPFIHAHAVVSGSDFKAIAGHFFSAEVAVTGEFVIRPAGWKVERILDDATSLKLMDIPDQR